MTPTWDQNPHSFIWWLRAEPDHHDALGLMHRDRTDINAGQWRVCKWHPREIFIAYLPEDTPEADALDAAQMLILLSLKEKDST